ncbi:hypothetical protein ACFL1X_01520 [Candidatus Hydrogenedentota bacterium]
MVQNFVSSSFRNARMMELIADIEENGSHGALDEFLSRPQIRIGRKFCTVIDMINTRLKNTCMQNWGHTREAAELACDILTDRLSNLRGDTIEEESSVESRPSGPNCKVYYKALRQFIEKSRKPGASILEEEAHAIRFLDGFLWHQFKMCTKEALRQLDVHGKRFYWKRNGCSIRLRVPRNMKDSRIRAWLEAHIDDFEPSRPGERERIQNVIDRNLVFGKQTTLPDYVAARNDVLAWTLLHGISVLGIAKVIATEKRENPKLLKPAIRALGREMVWQLIMQVFRNLAEDNDSDAEIARMFGLSSTTYWRFAGRPRKGRNRRTRVPDLFLNAAMILNRHPAWRETCIDLGFLPPDTIQGKTQ